LTALTLKVGHAAAEIFLYVYSSFPVLLTIVNARPTEGGTVGTPHRAHRFLGAIAKNVDIKLSTEMYETSPPAH